MFRALLNFFKFILVVTGSIFLSTLAINAADSWKNSSNSMLAGALSGIVDTSPCPEGMAYVGASEGGYCIDLYENAASEACLFDVPKNQEETRSNLTDRKCAPVSRKGTVPWRNISQNQAVQACAKAGKRLPTNEEWFFAALGTPDPSEGWKINDCNVNKNRDSSEPAITGSGENCISSLGVYDMVGNVWEWVSETVKEGKFDGVAVPDAGYVTASNELGIPVETNTVSDINYNDDRFWIKKESTTGMFRGGFWSSGSDAGIYSIHSEMPPSFIGNAIGFRCVK